MKRSRTKKPKPKVDAELLLRKLNEDVLDVIVRLNNNPSDFVSPLTATELKKREWSNIEFKIRQYCNRLPPLTKIDGYALGDLFTQKKGSVQYKIIEFPSPSMVIGRSQTPIRGLEGLLKIHVSNIKKVK